MKNCNKKFYKKMKKIIKNLKIDYLLIINIVPFFT